MRLGSSSDSDLYYDFDLEPESPASPAEEAIELVVEQQPKPVVEPESGCTSSFFGTSPGSDSSDSFGPDAFVSPSTSPAWFTARRRISPPSYDKCNGHAAPLLQNGSAYPPKENGSAHQSRENETALTLKEDESTRLTNGSAHAHSENGSAHTTGINGSAHQFAENGSSHPALGSDSSQTVLDHESALAVLENGSAVPLQENGSAGLQWQYIWDHTFTGNARTHENEDNREPNNTDVVSEDHTVHVRNALNTEHENERLTDIICSMESITVQDRDGSDTTECTIVGNDVSEIEGTEHCPDLTFNQSASLNLSQEEEIELLPSENFSDDKTFTSQTKEYSDDIHSSFRFNDENWEDRFSDYSPGDTFAGEDEQETVKLKETLEDPSITDLKSCVSDSDYQSTFSRDENVMLECPSHTLTSEIVNDEPTPSVLAELCDLPRQSSWESQKEESGPRLTSTLIINREDNLRKDVQVPEVWSSECTVEQQTEDKVDETSAATTLSRCTSPPPQLICDLSKDDEQSDEEESSREDDVDRLKPEPQPRRRRKTEEEKENEGDEDSPRQRLRRCSSLKTGKTPPGTPHRKKIVRFADVLGLDLADVRTFLDEIPRIPSSAYDDLQDADLSLGSLANPVIAAPINPVFSAVAGPDPTAALSLSLCAPCKTLMPTFQQPGGQTDFLERIRTRFVCLENAAVNDAATSSIAGIVRVRNLDFHKSVYVRYSIDGWSTYSDLQATYIPSSCDGFSDKFSFVLFAHTLTVGQKLEFAVRFQCKGAQYWDSNGGANYGFQCLPATSPVPYLPLSGPDDRWVSFY